MLDANSSFLTMAQTMAVLSIWRSGTGVVPMVIVGIGYPTEQAFDGVRRGFDYTPAALPGGPEQHHAHRLPYPMGGAERFLDFIEGDLKPLIAREYPIDPGRQALFGHSFGGLFRAACAVHPRGMLSDLRGGEPVDHLGRAGDHRRGSALHRPTRRTARSACW